MGRIMDILKPEFWSAQLPLAMQAWAIVVPLLILVFLIAWKIKSAVDDGEVRGLKAHKEFLEAQLQQAREKNLGGAKEIADIQREIAELRRLIAANAQASALEPIIKTVETTAGALAANNIATHHILSAVGLSVGSGNAVAISATENAKRGD